MPMENGQVTFTNGVFVGLNIWGQFEMIPRTPLSGEDLDAMLVDLGLMLENFVTRDGQNAPIKNLPMSGYRHTGVGKAGSRDEYATLEQLQDSDEFIPPDNVMGEPNAIEVFTTPNYRTLKLGQVVRFFIEEDNTGPVTLDVNNIRPIPLKTLDNEELQNGDLLSGRPLEAMYDGTSWRITSVTTVAGGMGGTGGLTQSQVLALMASWARRTSTARIPDDRISTAIARRTQIAGFLSQSQILALFAEWTRASSTANVPNDRISDDIARVNQLVNFLNQGQVDARIEALAPGIRSVVRVIATVVSYDAAQNRFEDFSGNEVPIPDGAIVTLPRTAYDAAVADADFTPNPKAIFLTR